MNILKTTLGLLFTLLLAMPAETFAQSAGGQISRKPKTAVKKESPAKKKKQSKSIAKHSYPPKTNKSKTKKSVTTNKQNEVPDKSKLLYNSSSSMEDKMSQVKDSSDVVFFTDTVIGSGPSNVSSQHIDNEYPVLAGVGSSVTQLQQGKAIDLGLPSGTLWADRNIGASSPEDCGDYFAWGDISPKSVYDWSAYKYCRGTKKTMTKYNYKRSYGKVDNKTTLEPDDDAATANWGSSWRMPTYEEHLELRKKCTWTWTTQNGMKGYKVTGPNGNSIFLPAAGLRNDSGVSETGSYGYYWLASLNEIRPYYAWIMYFGLDRRNSYYYYHYRCEGRSVRAVAR